MSYILTIGFIMLSIGLFTSCDSNHESVKNSSPEEPSLRAELEELQSEIDLLNDAIATDDLILDSLVELGVIPTNERTAFQHDYLFFMATTDSRFALLEQQKEATELMGVEFDSIQRSRDEKEKELKGLMLAKEKIEKTMNMHSKSLEELKKNLNELSE